MPKDCYKVVQWVYLLGVWNTNSLSVFLSVSNSSSLAIPPPPAPIPQIFSPINNRNNIFPRSTSQPEYSSRSAWFSHSNQNKQQQQQPQLSPQKQQVFFKF